MTNKTKLTILSKLNGEDVESLSVDDPYGIIEDHTYGSGYFLVEWPDEEQ